MLKLHNNVKVVCQARKMNMNFWRFPKEKLIPILINRTAIFFFLMCLLTIFLYAAGTAQGFIDSTQLALLRLYLVLGVFLCTSSVFGIFLEIIRVIRQKLLRYLFRALGYLFLLAFGASTVMAVLFIIALSEGTG